MHRNLDATAAVLGLGPRKLRQRLRELGILDHAGELACQYRDKGHLFIETRSRWNASINGWTHYGLVMVTETGLDWLAKQLHIDIKRMPPDEDAA